MKTTSYLFTLAIAATTLGCTLVDAGGSDSGPALTAEEEILASSPQAVPPAEELTSILHGGDARTWRPIAFTIMGIGGFLDCRLDDQMTLRSDGTYDFDGGQNLCGGIDSPTGNGTWSSINDGNGLAFTLGGTEFTAEVTGAVQDTISLSGEFQALPIRGIYVAVQ